jgi:hypothetical protein
MDKQLVDKIVEESIKQLGLREGLGEADFKPATFANSLYTLNVPENYKGGMFKVGFDRDIYTKLEREAKEVYEPSKNIVNLIYLRGVVINKNAKYESKLVLTKK